MKSKIENKNYESQINETLTDSSESKRLQNAIKVIPENIIYDSKEYEEQLTDEKLSKIQNECSDNANELQRIAVDKLAECICTAKVGEDYILNCTIPEKGKFIGICNAKANALIARQKKTQQEYEIVLSEVATETLKKAIEKAEKIISRLPITEGATFNYYRKGTKYTFVFSTTENEIKIIHIESDIDFATVIETLRRFSIYKTAPTTVSELEQNPFFDLAKQKNDEETQIWLQNYYIKWYAKFKKYQNEKYKSKLVLPIVSEEFNKDYIIDADTVNIALLDKNGYTIHRRASTYTDYRIHGYWTLNPYKRTAIEGAKDATNAIIFSDYLAQFSNLN